MTRWTLALRLLLALACAMRAAPVRAQTGANVLVVINSASSASETVGRHYATRRNVPSQNICSIAVPPNESVNRDVYDVQIEQPIWRCIANAQAQDRILYIVLTKDVPLRVVGTHERNGTNASVDSELTLLYRRRTDLAVPVSGFVQNPYFAGNESPPAGPFSHRAHDFYLVTRLDGYSIQDALSLIDRGVDATSDGVFALADRPAGANDVANRWVASAVERLKSQGLIDRVRFEDGATLVTSKLHLLGFYAWGSNEEATSRRSFGFDFAKGAVAAMLVGTDARTFKEPPASWAPGGQARFAGTTEPLIGDLIRAGVTGVSGNVDEPYLDASIRPDILFPAYASGNNLAEAFYAAMPYLGWQTIVVGDPLCRPFPRAALAADELDPPIDAATEEPRYFGDRKLAAMHPALSRDAGAAFIRFKSRMLRGDIAGARKALEDAVVAEPRFIPARVELATLYDRAGDRDREMAQYREILSSSPNDPFALNNLAYALAVYQNKPEEALPFAQRAHFNSKRDPELLGGTGILGTYYTLGSYHREPLVPYCLDTLAWVLHLLGRDAEAATTIEQARSAPGIQTADFMWHAAVIYSAIGDSSRAAAELNAALNTDPDLAKRDDVKQLRDRLVSSAK